ncbi:MAG: hypothetical protein ACREFC_02690 [Stellaceae bacterium]
MTDWDFIYAQIVAATGWSWDQVDAMTIPRYRALKRYWEEYPPAHLLLRALAGYQRRRPAAAAPFDMLVALAPDGKLHTSGSR